MEKIIFEDYPSTETPISADNLNQMQDNIEKAVDTKIESGLYCASVTLVATNGIVNLDISHLGLTSTPPVVLLTIQHPKPYPIIYDFDNSTATNLSIYLGGEGVNVNGIIRFCYLIVP